MAVSYKKTYKIHYKVKYILDPGKVKCQLSGKLIELTHLTFLSDHYMFRVVLSAELSWSTYLLHCSR